MWPFKKKYNPKPTPCIRYIGRGLFENHYSPSTHITRHNNVRDAERWLKCFCDGIPVETILALVTIEQKENNMTKTIEERLEAVEKQVGIKQGFAAHAADLAAWYEVSKNLQKLFEDDTPDPYADAKAAFEDGLLQTLDSTGKWVDWEYVFPPEFFAPPHYYRRKPKVEKVEPVKFTVLCWDAKAHNDHIFAIETSLKALGVSWIRTSNVFTNERSTQYTLEYAVEVK